jgi:predicted PurR-regulated permease PerM
MSAPPDKSSPEKSPGEKLEGELKEPVPDVPLRMVGDETAQPVVSSHWRTSTAVWILALIALVGALYLAQPFFVPLLFGVLVSNALSPLVDWFERYHVPRVLGSALVLAMLVGGVSWITISLSDDAAAIVQKLPEAARALRQSLRSMDTTGPSVLQQLQKAADELERAAAEAGLKSPESPVVIAREAGGHEWLRDFLLKQSALLVAFAAQTPVVLLLTYFLLASGTHFRLKLVKLVGPSLTRKKDAIRILEEIHVQIQRYLLVLITSNALIAVLTWRAFEMFELEHAGVWGVAAGVLRFIPYIGTAIVVLGTGITGLLQFGSLPLALALAATSALISGTVGVLFATWLHGRFARVNEAVLFIALLFFAWLWGVAGLLLGAPLLAITKVVCDRIDPLKPVGEMLGR